MVLKTPKETRYPLSRYIEDHVAAYLAIKPVPFYKFIPMRKASLLTGLSEESLFRQALSLRYLVLIRTPQGDYFHPKGFVKFAARHFKGKLKAALESQNKRYLKRASRT